jgi:hypothetical protein
MGKVFKVSALLIVFAAPCLSLFVNAIFADEIADNTQSQNNKVMGVYHQEFSTVSALSQNQEENVNNQAQDKTTTTTLIFPASTIKANDSTLTTQQPTNLEAANTNKNIRISTESTYENNQNLKE